jgi:hypothetical protein
MQLVILLLAFLALFIYLTLGARRDPDKRKLYYLFIIVDLWLTSVFVYLVVSAILDYN